jgi:hypothetical protein
MDALELEPGNLVPAGGGSLMPNAGQAFDAALSALPELPRTVMQLITSMGEGNIPGLSRLFREDKFAAAQIQPPAGMPEREPG